MQIRKKNSFGEEVKGVKRSACLLTDSCKAWFSPGNFSRSVE